MYQIKQQDFDDHIQHLKKRQIFIDFVKRANKRVKAFLLDPSFKYKIRNKKGTKVYKISKKGIGALDTKFRQHLNLLSDVEQLIYLPPAKLLVAKAKLTAVQIDEKNVIEVAFSHKIQQLLGYATLRSGEDKLLSYFYDRLGVKSCIYCNSQHTIRLDNKSRTMRLQADHRFPKITFPAFSITLSNLYPTCNNCNHLKSEKELKYNLYFDHISDSRHDLRFHIDEASLSKYCINRNIPGAEKDLIIKFIDYYNGNVKNSSKINDVLEIDKIYESFKYLVADFINKKIVYNDTYKASLSATFQQLFPPTSTGVNDQLFNQLLYGHSLLEDDINKKIFGKIIVDVEKQLRQYKYNETKNDLEIPTVTT